MLRKTMVSVMVISLVAMLIGLGTFAYFNDTQRIYDNTFATGTLDIDGTSNFPLNFTNLAPGGTYTQDVAVHLAGTLPADIYFGMQHQSGADLSKVLTVAILDVDLGTWVTSYQNAAYYSLNWTRSATNVSPGQWKNYRVYVFMDSAADNNYQNLTNYTQVILYATQVGAPAPTTAPWQYQG